MGVRLASRFGFFVFCILVFAALLSVEIAWADDSLGYENQLSVESTNPNLTIEEADKQKQDVALQEVEKPTEGGKTGSSTTSEKKIDGSAGSEKSSSEDKRTEESYDAKSEESDSEMVVASANTVVTTPATKAELEASLPSTEEAGVVMYRLYNPYTGEHLYTASKNERDTLAGIGWIYEGIGWIAPSSGDPVFRLYNPFSSDHHYTLETNERDTLARIGWIYEGVGWFSGGAQALLRQFNPNETIGTHNYTCSKNENDTLVRLGWYGEGIGWYALADTESNFKEVIKDTYVGVLGRVSSNDKDVHISSNVVNGTYYLMLPSFADLTAVRLSGVVKGAEASLMVSNSVSSAFKVIQAGSMVNVAALSTTTDANGAHILWFKTSQTSSAQKLGIMVSSSVSSLYVNSVNAKKDRMYVEASADHSAKADVNVTVIDKDGTAIYNKDDEKNLSSIKGRGNSTWGIGNKKPYQISLSKKADLLETGDKANKQKKWILLANANDVTLLHNTVAFDMALELGMVGTECRPVDLYYDGQYRGSYLLCEKIQINEGRIDIEDLEDAFEKANPGVKLETLSTERAANAYGKTYQYVRGVANPKDITGGYLLEIDTAYYSKEACWFETSWGVIVVKSPEYCSQSAMRYISEYVELAIRRFNSGQTTETAGGVHDGALIDLDSYAKTYLVSEFAKNIDAFLTSTYLYKDAGASQLYFQPVWDFDGAMGVRSDWHDSSFMIYQGFSLPHAPERGARVSVVQECVRSIWSNQLSSLIKNVLLSTSLSAVGSSGYLHSLAYYRQQISSSQCMDEVLYGLTAFNNEITPYASYSMNYDYFCNWLSWRAAWLDDNIWRISNGSINNSPFIYNGTDYGLVFDASYYIKMNKGILGSNISDAAALRHFVTVGMSLGLVASRNFNALVYKARFADLRQAYGNTLSSYYWHYMNKGFREGRNAL